MALPIPLLAPVIIATGFEFIYTPFIRSRLFPQIENDLALTLHVSIGNQVIALVDRCHDVLLFLPANHQIPADIVPRNGQGELDVFIAAGQVYASLSAVCS